MHRSDTVWRFAIAHLRELMAASPGGPAREVSVSSRLVRSQVFSGAVRSLRADSLALVSDLLSEVMSERIVPKELQTKTMTYRRAYR